MNSVCISGYINSVGKPRVVSGDNKLIDVIVAVKKQSTDSGKKYDYIKCVCWRGAAEYIEKYGNVSDFVVVQGRLSTSKYEDKDGKTVYETNINVTDITIPKKSDTSSNEQSENTIKHEGYVDVGKTSADVVNGIYKGETSGYEESLPF